MSKSHYIKSGSKYFQHDQQVSLTLHFSCSLREGSRVRLPSPEVARPCCATVVEVKADPSRTLTTGCGGRQDGDDHARNEHVDRHGRARHEGHVCQAQHAHHRSHGGAARILRSPRVPGPCDIHLEWLSSSHFQSCPLPMCPPFLLRHNVLNLPRWNPATPDNSIHPYFLSSLLPPSPPPPSPLRPSPPFPHSSLPASCPIRVTSSTAPCS